MKDYQKIYEEETGFDLGVESYDNPFAKWLSSRLSSAEERAEKAEEKVRVWEISNAGRNEKPFDGMSDNSFESILE